MSSVRRKKQKAPVKEILLILLCFSFICVVVGGATWYLLGNEKKELDKATFCPIVKGEVSPVATLTFLLDETDPLTPIQQDFVQVTIEKMVRDVEPGTLVSIYTLSGEGTITRKPIFERCKIRDGSDADPLTENEKLLKKRFNANFKAPLTSIMRNLADLTVPGKESKIMEQIQAASVNTMQKWRADGLQTLVIFSDMLQNSKGFSMYKERDMRYESFKRLPYASEVKSNLLGVQVEVFYFITNPRLQKNRNVTFWKDYFKNAGARVERVEPVGR